MFRRSRATALPLLLLPFSIGACDDGDQEMKPLSTTELRGSFISEGYGFALEGDGRSVRIYELTERSCLMIYETPVEQLTFPEADLQASYENNRLVLRDSGTFELVARPVVALPARCANGGTQRTDDPVESFEIFQSTFAEQYAFFDLREVDWADNVANFRPRVSAATSNAELFGVLCEMVKPLRDGHVSIGFGDEGCAAEELSPDITENADALRAYNQRLSSAEGMSTALGGTLAWGKLNPDVGYILILQMVGDGDSASKQAESMSQAIDRVIADLIDAKHVIIDVRTNPGGYDNIALVIAGRFADESRDAYTKKARNGNGFTAERRFRVEPAGPRQFTGDTMVLTSKLTASAAEIFAMAMRVLPHVTVIGERTSGAHSDVLGRNLPNGMQFGLSNEVYRAADGHVYERAGIPPSVDVPFDPAAIARGQDRILEAALAHAALR